MSTGPVLFLSCEAIQWLIDAWLEEQGICAGERVAYQWLYDRDDQPVGVNVWHEGDIEELRESD